MPTKPTLFIGSSSELLPVARVVGAKLKGIAKPEVWDKKVFGLSTNTLEALLDKAATSDLAVFVFGPEDVRFMRKNLHRVPRDNVVFELGMFFGRLARERCFFLVPKHHNNFKVPSDLAGITAARYDHARRSVPSECVDGACIELRDAIRALREAYGLSGSWTHSWVADGKPRGSCDGEARLELVQLGRHIHGTFSWDKKTWNVRGHIDGDRYLTAEYRANVKHGYFGTLHMVIAPTGRTIAGRWAGWSSSKADVNSGRCTWTLNTPT